MTALSLNYERVERPLASVLNETIECLRIAAVRVQAELGFATSEGA